MSPSAFDKTLRAFQKRIPFRPFTVALVNGDRFQADHPEALVFRGGNAVYLATNGDMTIFDNEGVNEFIDIKSAHKPKPKPNNGSH